MAQFTLNIVEDLPIGNSGVDQLVSSIDSWGNIDSFIEQSSDSLAATASLSLSETFGTSDSLSSTAAISLSETLGTSDAVFPVRSLVLSEIFGLSTLGIDQLDNLLDIIGPIDTYDPTPDEIVLSVTKPTDYTFGLSTLGIDQLDTPIDTVGLIDTYDASPDEIVLSVTKPTDYTFGLSTLGIDQLDTPIDTVGLIDTYDASPDEVIFSVTKPTEYAFGLSDEFARTSVLTFLESLGIEEASNNTVTILTNYLLAWAEDVNFPFRSYTIDESLQILDPLSKDVSSTFVDSLKIVDKIQKRITFINDISLVLSEFSNNIDGYGIFYVESIAIQERLQLSVSKIISEQTISLLDSIKFDIRTSLHDSLNIGDTFGKSYYLDLLDNFHIIDDYLRALEAKVSHMILLSDPATSSEDFEDLVRYGAPSGYNTYVPYLQGNYEFKDARIKTVVDAELDTDSGIELSRIDVYVDIPDTTDRSNGSVAVSAAATQAGGVAILFSRGFYQPPELVITLANTTVLKIPKVTNKTNLGFTIQVYDASGVTPIDADISWMAQGY